MKTVAAVVALVLVVSDGTLSREQRLGAAVSTSTEILQACREQRLDGALPNFSASVACSNPGIRATIAATEYPHMDVIDRWLSYRVAVAGRADAGELSEVEATSLLSELTYRITTDSMHIVHPHPVAHTRGVMAGAVQKSNRSIVGRSAPRIDQVRPG